MPLATRSNATRVLGRAATDKEISEAINVPERLLPRTCVLPTTSSGPLAKYTSPLGSSTTSAAPMQRVSTS